MDDKLAEFETESMRLIKKISLSGTCLIKFTETKSESPMTNNEPLSEFSFFGSATAATVFLDQLTKDK